MERDEPTAAESRLAMHKTAIETFFKGVEEHNVDLIAPLLAEDVVEEIPFNPSGSTAPAARFEGKKAVMGYWTQVVTNFSRTVLVDKRIYAAEDGTVFFEGKGRTLRRALGRAQHPRRLRPGRRRAATWTTVMIPRLPTVVTRMPRMWSSR